MIKSIHLNEAKSLFSSHVKTFLFGAKEESHLLAQLHLATKVCAERFQV